MIKALAPGWPRGCSRVLLAIVLGGAWPVLALAQRGESTKKAAAQPKDEPAKGAPPAETKPAAKGPAAISRGAEENKKAEVDATSTQKVEPTQVWKDPNAAATLKNEFKELPAPARALTKAEVDAVNTAAAGGAADRALLKRYVDSYAADLTKHAFLEGLLEEDDPANPNNKRAAEDRANRAKRIEAAGQALASPLIQANAAKNTAFRSEYTKILAPTVQTLLANHYFARLQGIIALSRSADPAAIPTFIATLRDRNQLLAVKERAAVGLAQVAQGGRVEIEPAQAIAASEALVEFLQNDAKTFWPAQARALEALGAFRQSNPAPNAPQADFATAALSHLADPKARPDVRASAAWALGWMRVNNAAGKYNFPLVAYHMGQAAADLGTRVVQLDSDRNPYQARHVTSLILSILEAFDGEQGVPNSGLLRANHPNFASARGFIEGVEQRVRDIARAAIDLDRQAFVRPPANPAKAKNFRDPRAPYRAAVTAKVNDLKSFLAKNPPADKSLVPGGPQFPGVQAQVAAGEK